MSEWSIFWICLFSYWAIKYVIERVTYCKRDALKELTREECEKVIKEIVGNSEVEKTVDELFDNIKKLREKAKRDEDDD